jgi:hypothetical protein
MSLMFPYVVKKLIVVGLQKEKSSHKTIKRYRVRRRNGVNCKNYENLLIVMFIKSHLDVKENGTIT